MESWVEMESFVYSDLVVNDLCGGKIVCVFVFIVLLLFMFFCGEFFVSIIDEVINGSGVLLKFFIGFIILFIVGNIVEYVIVVIVGVRGKLDLVIVVVVGLFI